MAEITTTEIPEDRRYAVAVDGQPAGFAGYVDRGGRRLFVHTEVDPAFGGQGVGSSLVRSALSDCRERGIAIVPLCPFVASWVESHPDFADLVDTDVLDALG